MLLDRAKLALFRSLSNFCKGSTRRTFCGYHPLANSYQTSSKSKSESSKEDFNNSFTSVNSENNALMRNGKPCTISQGHQSGIIHELVGSALLNLGFTKLTPVQAKSIEHIVGTNNDLIVKAKTGTGKTLAFGIPAIQQALKKSNRYRSVQTIVVAPTRDLAFQIRDEFNKVIYQCLLEDYHKRSVIVQTLVGGENRWQQMKAFENRYIPSIVVATPGRFLDIIQEPIVRPFFSHVQTIVLDEADRLLGDGFRDDLMEISSVIKGMNIRKQCPKTMLFSATLDKNVIQFSKQILRSDAKHIDTVDPNEPETHEKINQSLVLTNNFFESVASAIVLIENEAKRSKHFKAIVFLPTIKGVSYFYEILNQHLKEKKIQLNSNQLHGQLSQAVRDRSVRTFRTCFSGVLIASDVGARGMDFPNVTNVIQIGLPMDSTNYVHRVGRTARAGNTGKAVIILSRAESRFVRLLKERNVAIEEQFEYKPVVHLEKRIIDVSHRAKHKYSLDLVIESLAGFTKGVLGSYRLNMFEILDELKNAYGRFHNNLNKKPRVSIGFANQVLGLKRKDAEELFDLTDAENNINTKPTAITLRSTPKPNSNRRRKQK